MEKAFAEGENVEDEAVPIETDEDRAPVRRRRRWRGWFGSGAAALSLLAAAGWGYYSPRWTVDRMVGLAEAGDGRTLITFVDVPSFRADLVAQLRIQMSAPIDGQGGPDFDVMSNLATGPMSDQMADFMITANAFMASFAPEANPHVLAPGGLLANHMKLERDGLFQFHLHADGEKPGHGDLIFRLQGLSWRLVGINLRAKKTAAENERIAKSLGIDLGDPQQTNKAALSPDAVLMAKWDSANDECRGGSDSSDKTPCDVREQVGAVLEKHGWCFVYSDWRVYPPDYKWHDCKETHPAGFRPDPVQSESAPPPDSTTEREALNSQWLVTGDQYAQLRNGMTYGEVLDVIGSPGEQMASTSFGGTENIVVSWKNYDGSNMMATFQNGRLVTKAQYGLP